MSSSRSAAEQVTAQPPPSPARGPAFDLEDIQEDIGPSGGLVAPRSLDIAKPGRSGLNVAWLAAGSGILILTLVLVVVGVLLAMRSPPARPVPLAAVKKEDNKEPKGKVAEAVDPKQEKPAEVNPPALPPPAVQPEARPRPGQGVQDVPGTPKARKFQTLENHIRWLSLAPDGSKVAVGDVFAARL